MFYYYLTLIRDTVVKHKLYLDNGVQEYWIIDPDNKTLTINLFDKGRYYTTTHDENDNVPINIFKDCIINLSEIFKGIE